MGAQSHRPESVARDIPRGGVVCYELLQVPDVCQGGEGVKGVRAPVGEFPIDDPADLAVVNQDVARMEVHMIESDGVKSPGGRGP